MPARDGDTPSAAMGAVQGLRAGRQVTELLATADESLADRLAEMDFHMDRSDVAKTSTSAWERSSSSGTHACRSPCGEATGDVAFKHMSGRLRAAALGTDRGATWC